jgi:UDP-GlcNAc:undecaprenyl-phosphate GlcNAc-1-phosphate transferase
VNAVNLIDGLDGLAAGVAFLACVVNVVVGLMSGAVLVTLVATSLGGALLGFLVYNFNPATIFMGDSGSMFVGYVLATTALLGAGAKATTAVSLLVPVLAMGVPIFDTLFAMVRRFLERRPLFSPDRGHIHHRLLDMGVTHRRAVLLLYGLSLVFCVAAVTVYIGRSWQIAFALGVSAVVIVGLVRGVGLFQFRVMRRMQREHSRSAHAELFRYCLPGLIGKVSLARDVSSVRAELIAFGQSSKLVFIDCRGPGAAGFNPWSWEADKADGSDDASKTGGRGYVSAKFPLRVGLGVVGEMKFGWYSDQGDVSAQSDALLQVVVDAVERRLVELAEHSPGLNMVEPVGGCEADGEGSDSRPPRPSTDGKLW